MLGNSQCIFCSNMQPLRFCFVYNLRAVETKMQFSRVVIAHWIARDCELLNRLPSFSMPMQTLYLIEYFLTRFFIHVYVCLCKIRLIIECHEVLFYFHIPNLRYQRVSDWLAMYQELLFCFLLPISIGADDCCTDSCGSHDRLLVCRCYVQINYFLKRLLLF